MFSLRSERERCFRCAQNVIEMFSLRSERDRDVFVALRT